MKENEDLVTTQQCLTLLNISMPTFRRRVKAGELPQPHSKQGNTVMYSLHAMKATLENRKADCVKPKCDRSCAEPKLLEATIYISEDELDRGFWKKLFRKK